LEKRLEEVFQTIMESALAREINAKEKLQKIAQMMDGYKKEIRELVEKMTPTTPLEVRLKGSSRPQKKQIILHWKSKK
jgi:hypothetical protein